MCVRCPFKEVYVARFSSFISSWRVCEKTLQRFTSFISSLPVCVRCAFFLLYLLITSMFMLPVFTPLSPLHQCVYVTRLSLLYLLITLACLKNDARFSSFISSSPVCVRCPFFLNFISLSLACLCCPFLLLYLLFTSVCTLPVFPPLSPLEPVCALLVFRVTLSPLVPEWDKVERLSSFIILSLAC